MAVRLSALRAGRPLPQAESWCSFLLEAESSPGTAERIKTIAKSNDLIENRTRDLPACSIVPQPTTLPRVSANSHLTRQYSQPLTDHFQIRKSPPLL
jgi:hypothetical protein